MTKCAICDGTEWENVDKYRIKEEGMSICKTCSFISYPNLYQNEEQIKEYYRKEYRQGPKINNWFSGQRKLHFHNAFLKELFESWKTSANTKPVIGEVGAAYGLFLNYARGIFPEADVSGTELTLSYRRNAYHEFGLELTEEFDESKKYDLIASYKVAEHQWDIDKILRRYVLCLKENGHIYISVPTWFGKLNNFGAGGFDLEYYYHKNHINVWTRKLFETLLRKVGLKVVKFNDTMYDDTYLCVRDDSLMTVVPEYEVYEDMIDRLKRVKAAGEAFMEGRYADAIAAYPNFPEAYVSMYEMSRAKLHQPGVQDAMMAHLKQALNATNGCPEILCLGGDMHMRYDKFEKALKYFEKAAAMKPGFSTAIKAISQCFRNMGHRGLRDGDLKTGYRYLYEAREAMKFVKLISAQDEYEAINWTYDDNSRLPTPAEVRDIAAKRG